MLSYEVAFGFGLLSVFLIVGSLNLSEIVHYQVRGGWLVFPLLPVFLVFFVTILAETNRHPFDLPEAEAELQKEIIAAKKELRAHGLYN